MHETYEPVRCYDCGELTSTLGEWTGDDLVTPREFYPAEMPVLCASCDEGGPGR